MRVASLFQWLNTTFLQICDVPAAPDPDLSAAAGADHLWFPSALQRERAEAIPSAWATLNSSQRPDSSRKGSDPRFVARAPARRFKPSVRRSSDMRVEIGHSINLRKQNEN